MFFRIYLCCYLHFVSHVSLRKLDPGVFQVISWAEPGAWARSRLLILLNHLQGGFQVVSWAEPGAWASVSPAAVQRGRGGTGPSCTTTLELLILEEWGRFHDEVYFERQSSKLAFGFVAWRPESIVLPPDTKVTCCLKVCVWGLEDLSLLFSSKKAIANKFRTASHPEVRIQILWYLWW